MHKLVKKKNMLKELKDQDTHTHTHRHTVWYKLESVVNGATLSYTLKAYTPSWTGKACLRGVGAGHYWAKKERENTRGRRPA